MLCICDTSMSKGDSESARGRSRRLDNEMTLFSSGQSIFLALPGAE
jgi:hypothetical protein